MNRLLFCLAILGLATANTPLLAAGPGDEVIVIYNTRVPESRDVAQHYASVRQVPPGQVFGLDLPTEEAISRADYRLRLQTPLLKLLDGAKLMQFDGPASALTDDSAPVVKYPLTAKIRYAVLCYGVPLRIVEDPEIREQVSDELPSLFRRNEAAVDSELACLPISGGRIQLTGPRLNEFYAATNATLFHPTNGILMVARLDGPTAAVARALVDKAVQGETEGLWGRAYFDLRGLTNGEYKPGDDSIRGASEVCRALGYETIVDSNAATFPASFPMSQIAFYAGWYEPTVCGPFARPTVEFMPGAFAYHLHSYSAFTIRSPNLGWVGPLIAKGATATMGCVAEPVLLGTPDMSVFFPRFTHLGFTFGEAAWASQRFLSWQTTVVGDPLYRPFGRSPQQIHADLERRHDPRIEWSWLRILNLGLAGGRAAAEGIADLQSFPLTRDSAVLTEKMADLYFENHQAAASVSALEAALKLQPTPQQRVRLMLSLADRLLLVNRATDAYAVLQRFLKTTPDYPDELAIYRRLLKLAQMLGKNEEAADYERQISRLTPAPGEPRK